MGEQWGPSRGDPDRVLLLKCLDYLTLLADMVKPYSKPRADAEYALLEYAVMNWPYHYMRTSKRGDLIERVLETFQGRKLEV